MISINQWLSGHAPSMTTVAIFRYCWYHYSSIITIIIISFFQEAFSNINADIISSNYWLCRDQQKSCQALLQKNCFWSVSFFKNLAGILTCRLSPFVCNTTKTTVLNSCLNQWCKRLYKKLASILKIWHQRLGGYRPTR